jgi:type III secretion system FlhB-like substrate exporter
MKKEVLSLIGFGPQSKESDDLVVKFRGEGKEAAVVLKLAKHYGIPIIEREGVVVIFSDIDNDERIPKELYKIITVLSTEIEKDLLEINNR